MSAVHGPLVITMYNFTTPRFEMLILNYNPAFRLAERPPPSFSHSAETNYFARPRFRLKMADIMKKKQQNKMALTFLIVDGFGHLNMQIDSVLSGESVDVIVFLFGRKR